MNAIWKGAISFGLVNVPVKMYAATEARDTRFNYLHEVCKTPIRYQKVCPTCNRPVDDAEIVRGYEYEKGKYVIMREEDFDRIPVSSTRTIDIIDFVELAGVDPVYFSRSYFLVPNEGGQKAFALLRRALAETGKIAIARVVIRSRESLAAVRVYGRTLMMSTMFFPEEIRSADAFPELQAAVELHENEVKMAVSLIENLSAPFEPGRYTSNYRAALRELIAAKVAGAEVVTPEQREAGQVVDLMEALRASIEAAQKERQPGRARVAGGAGPASGAKPETGARRRKRG